MRILLEIPGFFQEYISKAAIAESMEVPRRAGTVRQEYTSDNKHLVIVKEIEGSDGVVKKLIKKNCVNRWSVIILMISICMKITLFS